MKRMSGAKIAMLPEITRGSLGSGFELFLVTLKFVRICLCGLENMQTVLWTRGHCVPKHQISRNIWISQWVTLSSITLCLFEVLHNVIETLDRTVPVIVTGGARTRELSKNLRVRIWTAKIFRSIFSVFSWAWTFRNIPVLFIETQNLRRVFLEVVSTERFLKI